MSEKTNQTQSQPSILVYTVVSYGQVVGCYATMALAAEAAAMIIAKNRNADIITKPLINDLPHA